MADNGWGAQLRRRPSESWPGFLAENSGLPGPRANLALVAAAATSADPDIIDILIEDGGEYTAMCAAAALAYHADESGSETRARRLAIDERWRVREGIALGLQLLGDHNPGALVRIVRAWVEDPHPLVQRAAVAAICEPRLLSEPSTAVAALDVCQRATAAYVALPTARRKDQDARSLRQALGYCWSIAVAAQPGRGVDIFSNLDGTDHDVAWIITQNRRKKRLASLL